MMWYKILYNLYMELFIPSSVLPHILHLSVMSTDVIKNNRHMMLANYYLQEFPTPVLKLFQYPF